MRTSQAIAAAIAIALPSTETSFHAEPLGSSAFQTTSATPRDSGPAHSGKPALELSYEWGDAIPERNREQYFNVIQQALTIVEAFPPAGDNLFSWSGDRSVLDHKEFRLVFTSSKDPALKTILESSGQLSSDGTDAGTAALYDGETLRIFTLFFADRIFFDTAGNERPDGLTRAIVALAHEIYGNVQQSLDLSLTQQPENDLVARQRREMAAFTAGIEFIHRVQASDEFSRLPVKMQRDLNEALKRDEVMLEDWQSLFSTPLHK